MPWMVHFVEKNDFFFHEIFQAGACPNLKVSSIHDFFSIHMYKTDIVRYPGLEINTRPLVFTSSLSVRTSEKLLLACPVGRVSFPL